MVLACAMSEWTGLRPVVCVPMRALFNGERANRDGGQDAVAVSVMVCITAPSSLASTRSTDIIRMSHSIEYVDMYVCCMLRIAQAGYLGSEPSSAATMVNQAKLMGGCTIPFPTTAA